MIFKETESDSVKDVDTTSRRVKVAISRMGNKDSDGDVIDKTAFNRTIKQRGPMGSNLIWHLTDHYPSLKNAVGKFSTLQVEGDHLIGLTDIPKTSWGNDVMEFYKTGNINQHSIGFKTVQEEKINTGKADEYNLIKEIFLYEGSAVLWGANPDTPTVEVGKSLTKQQAEEDFVKTTKEFNNLAKLFKDGHLSDQTFELIEMQITRLTDRLQQLFQKATQLAEEAPDPVEKSMLDVFQTFNNNLILQNESHRITSAIGCS